MRDCGNEEATASTRRVWRQGYQREFGESFKCLAARSWKGNMHMKPSVV